jgi:hypothetical protein
MKVGEGAAYCLYDIGNGISQAELTKRWKSGAYGPKGERPRAEYVAEWWKIMRG